MAILTNLTCILEHEARMNILDQIIDQRKDFIKENRPRIEEFLCNRNLNSLQLKNPRRKLSEVLNPQAICPDFKIISEIKVASPSKGVIFHKNHASSDGLFQPTINNIPDILEQMARGRTDAVSVLTEFENFKGSFGNLSIAHSLLDQKYPILMKDFIVDEIQLQIGQFCGASNALLIVDSTHNSSHNDNFNQMDIVSKIKLYQQCGLEPLVEIHSESDLDTLQSLQGMNLKFVIGINNRDLTTMKVDINTSIDLHQKIINLFGFKQPIITESGLNSSYEKYLMELNGIHGALIGTSIMQGNIAENVAKFSGANRPFIKLCGIQEPTDITKKQYEKIDALGVIYNVPLSPRNLSEREIEAIFKETPASVIKTIVSRCDLSEQQEFLGKIQDQNPDLIQLHTPKLFNLINALPESESRKMVYPIKIIRGAIRSAYQEITQLQKPVFAILIDSSEGKGKELEPSIVNQLMGAFPNLRFIVAGGIGIHNIKPIVEQLNPFGIDVSSSLERDGRKNQDLIDIFLQKTPKLTFSNSEVNTDV